MAVVRSCPQCGASVQDGDDFCGNCGTYLGWSAEAARQEPAVARSAVVEPERSQPERSQPVTSRPATPQPVGSQSATPQSATPQSATPQSATPQPMGPEPVGSQPMGPEPVGSQPVSPEPVGPESVIAEPGEPAGPDPGQPDAVEPDPAAGLGPETKSLATARPGLWARWRAWVRSRFGRDGGTPDTGQPGSAATSGRSAAARIRTTAGSEVAVGSGPANVVLGPVLPGRPEARRPLPTTGTEVDVDGPPCPVCGTTNPLGRRFCRRCATPLQDGTATAAAPRRRRARRGDTSRWLRRLAALLVVAVLAIGGIAFYPKAVELFEDLRDRLAKPVPITPARTTATGEVPDHPAAAAVDGLSNRYWGAPAVGDAVEFTFDQPFRLLSVVVHTGASTEPEEFRAQARPTAVDLVVTSSGGVTRTIAVALNDQPGPQRTDTGISDVVVVRLVVKSAAGLGPGRHPALGEVEFFRRS
jgi:hypothetical protein